MKKIALAAAFAASLLSVQSLLAQVQVTTTTFTDSLAYAVSNNDLLQTNLSLAAVTSGRFTTQLSGTHSLARLYDGNFGVPRDDYNNSEGFGDGAQVTFSFDLSANTAGYNISQIATYAAWDNGRDGQEYSVAYSLASAPETFIDLVFVPGFAGDVGDGYPDSRTSVSIQNAGGGDLISNVAALRFTFTGFENDGTAYREFDVIGGAAAVSAIPEPSTYAAMAGALSLGFVAWRRSRQVKSKTALV